mmetsp:Transcript_6405/g.18873  ORF Transcript_6405/g.18873 Transcript_6405/m.18873 type:complete len:225 (-) Transcript_6405:66-740(-)
MRSLCLEFLVVVDDDGVLGNMLGHVGHLREVVVDECSGNIIEHSVLDALDDAQCDAQIGDRHVLATDVWAIGTFDQGLELAEEGLSLACHVLLTGLLHLVGVLLAWEGGHHVLGGVDGLVGNQGGHGIGGVQLGDVALHGLPQHGSVSEDGDGLGVLHVSDLEHRNSCGVEPILLLGHELLALEADVLEVQADRREDDADRLGAAAVEVKVDELVGFSWERHDW